MGLFGVKKQPSVLILGFKHVGEQIARGLKRRGYVPVFADAPIGSVEELRQQVHQFSARASLGSLVHPGATFWAERPELATIAAEKGLSVIAPPAAILTLFNNKLSLVTEAEKVGIPNLVVAHYPMQSAREIEKLVAEFPDSIPLVLKSIRGSGSFGVCVLYQKEELKARVSLWIEQLRKRTGEVVLMTEHYLLDARHLVVPFCRDRLGNIQIFPIVDASLQSQFRKVIQVAPAQHIDTEVLTQIRDWTSRFSAHCNFVGLGNLEFLVDGRKAYLVDGSARLTSTFRLWEKVAGTSAVDWQLWTLDRGLLKAEPKFTPKDNLAVGISLQIYAEDSILHFPQPGHIREVSYPKHAGIFEAKKNTEVGLTHSGVLGNIFSFSNNYQSALELSKKFLQELWISGSIQTNERFLSELLDHSWVKEGYFCSGFVDEEFSPAVRPEAEMYRMIMSIMAPFSNHKGDRWSVNGQPIANLPMPVGWKKKSKRFKAKGSFGLSGEFLRLKGKRESVRFCVYPLDQATQWVLRIGNWFFFVKRLEENRVKRPRLLALVTGKVHSVLFREGVTIPAHQNFLIIESLGRLIPHAAPKDFIVKRWHVKAEDLVTIGNDLGEVDSDLR